MLVSHDRSLLRATADEFLAGRRRQGDAVRRRPGRLCQAPARRGAGAGRSSPRAGGQPQGAKRLEAEERNRRFAQRRPLEARIRSAEEEIAPLGAEKPRLETLIADPDLYDEARKDDLKRCLVEQAQVLKKLQASGRAVAGAVQPNSKRWRQAVRLAEPRTLARGCLACRTRVCFLEEGNLFKRIVLFLITNLAILLVLSFTAGLLGVDRMLAQPAAA